MVKNLSHEAANEAYILLTAYVREEGKVGAKYNKDHLKEFITFLHGVLSNMNNFQKEIENTEEATAS